MRSTQQIISDILRREGGFVNDPDDPGGPTNMGITQATLSDYLGRHASVDEVRNLDEDTAREIYERRYYTSPRIDGLPHSVRPFMADAAVNHGPRTAGKMLQRVLNEAGFGPLGVDGRRGPRTRAAAVRADAEMGPFLLAALVEARQAVYARLIKRNPSLARFEKGWMRRAEEFRPTETELETADV